MLFLNQAYADPFSLKKYGRDISKHLTSLSSDEPCCLWLTSENQTLAGIAVASGDGEGEYEIAYTLVDGIVTEAVVEFGVS